LATQNGHTSTVQVLKDLEKQAQLEQLRQADLVAAELLREEAAEESKQNCTMKKKKKKKGKRPGDVEEVSEQNTAAELESLHQGSGGNLSPSAAGLVGASRSAVEKDYSRYAEDSRAGAAASLGMARDSKSISTRASGGWEIRQGQDSSEATFLANFIQAPPRPAATVAEENDEVTNECGAVSPSGSEPDWGSAEVKIQHPFARSASAPAAGSIAGAGNETEPECCVCLELPKSHIFIPCGHFCVCQGCADLIMGASMQCPMCQQVCTVCARVFG
jgi:hypothetical protein